MPDKYPDIQQAVQARGGLWKIPAEIHSVLWFDQDPYRVIFFVPFSLNQTFQPEHLPDL
jgi:hypothetical protein